MTPAEYRALQNAMGMSNREFSDWLCSNERNGRRWAAGTQEIPAWIQEFGPFLVEAATGIWGEGARERLLALYRERSLSR